MAVSYKDYVKKYGKSIEEEQEKERKLKSSKNSSTLSLPVAKENLDIAKNNLKTYLEDNGVVTGNNTYSAPNLFTIRTKALQDNITKNKLIPMNPLEMETRDKENMEKYNQVSNTGEAGQLAKNIRLAANEVSKSKSRQEQLEAKERYESLSPFMKTLYEINAPVRGAASMIFRNSNIIQDERGVYTLPNYMEALHNEVTNGANLPGRIINDVGYQAGKLAVSAGLNAIAPGAGTAAYSGDMFLNNYDSAMRDGYTHQQATAYATVSTGLEYATQRLLGASVGRFKGDSPFEDLIGEQLKKIVKSNTVNKLLSTMTSEGTEEFVQEYLDQINRNITLGENEQIFTKERLKQAGYSALIGALSSGVTQGSGIIMRNNIQNNYEQIVYDLERENKTNLSEEEKAFLYNTIYEQNDNNGVINADAVKEYFNSTEGKTQLSNSIEESINTLEQVRKETESKKQQKKIDTQINELKEQLVTIQKQVQEKNNTLEKQLENQATRILEESETQREAMIENFKDYLEEHSIINPTQQDIDDSIIDLVSYDNDIDFADTARVEQLYNQYVKEYMKENGIPFNNANNSYRGSHQIENAKPLIDLNIKDIENKVTELNGYLTNQDQSDLRKLNKIFNNPNEDIKIYRAAPVNELNSGDWVTTDKNYAKEVANNNGGKVYEYTIKPSQLYYPDNIRELPSLHRLSSFQYIENTQPVISMTKGNIPINNNLLNKYSNVNEIFNNETVNYDGTVNVKNIDIDLKGKNATTIYHNAVEIFNKNHNTNHFKNDGNDIYVTNTDIKESINKVYNDRLQNKYLKEHLEVFSDLGDIIENSKLVNQTVENKNRTKYNTWNYYYSGLNIEGELFNLEFDVVSRQDGENHYRLQRLKKADTQSALPIKGEADFGASASTGNNTINLPKSQIAPLPINSNMQNNEKNVIGSNKTNDTLEIKLPKNPTLESSYDITVGKLASILDETPRTEQQKDNRFKILFATKILDKGYYVDKLARQYKNRELSAKYDYMLQSNGIANNIIGNGRYDNKGNKIGKSLYEIFEPAENAGLVKQFSEYLYNKHNIDRMSLEERYGEDNKPVFGKGLTAKDSKEIVENYERLHPEFKEWAKDVYEYNKANMQLLVDNGILSKEDMHYYQTKYPNYIPTMRANEAEQSIFKIDNGKILVGNPVKTAKGSNTDIIPLKEAMAIRTLQTVNSALRNDFGIELLKTIKNDAVLTSTSNTSTDDKVENIENSDIITPKSNGKNAKFSIFVDGARRTLDISEGIYEALTPRNVAKSKVLNKINNIRRALVTEYSPAFMITNPLKDIQDGSLNSKHPGRFAKSLPEAAMQIKTKGKLYQLYIANGGLQDTYFNYDNGLELPIKDQKTSKLDKINIPKKALNKVSSINEAIEMTPRLAEFIASLEAGDSLQTAMYNAQEITTNFKRGGDISKTIDANGVTFFNAGVQGALKQVRNIQDAKVNGLRGIASLAVKITALGLGSGLLNDLIWGDDDDYEDLSDYVKNNYYIIGKYGDGKYIRIPKGRVLSVIQKVFNEAIDGTKGKKVDFDQIIDLMKNQVLPNSPDESSIISPIKNVKENKTWYGSDLVPKRLQDVPNAEQYDENTDSLSIWLGEKLNYSPYKINYLLDQYSGVIGDMILPYLTKEAEYESESILAPIIDKFTTNSHLKNQNISDFYSLSDELKKKSNGKDATDEDKLRYKYVNSINSEISELYKQKRETQNMNLPTKEKYDQMIVKQKEINKLAKSTLNDYDNVDISSKGNYGTVNNTSYYKSVDSNGESKWTKIGEKNKGLNYATKLNMNMDKFVDYVNTDFKSDKDKNGKTITNSRKNKVIRYLNSSNLSDIEKKIILKMEYSSVNDYDTEIINYVKSNVSNTEERKEILEYLGFKIRNGKVYSK